MIVTVTKKALAGALALVERIIPPRSPSPGLSLLRVDARDGCLVLSGSNLDIDIEVSVTEMDADGEGSFAMPAAVFAQVVRAAPDKEIELRFEEQLNVRSGSFKTKIQLADLEQAHQLEFPAEYTANVSAGAFATALNSVRYASAQQDYQAIFRGINIEQRGEKARVVATDGFRLALAEFDGDLGLEKPVVMPSKSAEELVRVLGEGEVDVTITQSGRFSVRGESFRMNLGLMDGTFPDYERIIPSAFPMTAKVKAKDLIAAANRVSLMSDKQTNNRVDMLVQNGEMVLTAEGGAGHSAETLQVEQEGGDQDEMRLSFNAKYLTDALAPLDEAIMRFTQPGSPAVLKPTDEEQQYMAMVVPLRV